MIELNNDALLFSFPNTLETLRKLTKDYVQETVSLILGENREAALDEVLKDKTHFYFNFASDQKKVRQRMHKISRHKIAAAFEVEVRDEVRLDSESWSSMIQMTAIPK